MPDKLSKPGEEHRDPSNKGVKKNRDKLGGLLVETQIVTEKTDTEPVKDVVFLTKKYQKQLVAVRAKLKSLGWEPRSPEDTVSTQRKKEDKFLTNIKEIETGLGVKLSEESLRLARKKFEEDVQSDVQAYLAKFDSLLSQEKELVESIEDLGPDVSRAEEYWKQALDGETRIEAPMDPNCEISIVVPAFNEDPERVMRQIESLKKQKDITHGLFEVIYVVNND
ncbi:MAG: glycosyltransferase, partial [Candidatus Magasanikbacteria bacterium]|nr:glycosyltransferase [Candidatus Magasanikbacteria bacterium]